VLTAAGRSAGGFGLEFNPVKPGLLLGADLQGGVQLWDVGHLSSSSGGSNSGSTGRSVEVQAMQVRCRDSVVRWPACHTLRVRHVMAL
jgi:hypothetical protein